MLLHPPDGHGRKLYLMKPAAPVSLSPTLSRQRPLLNPLMELLAID